MPSPVVHSNLTPLASLAVADEHRPASRLKVSLGEHQGLVDPKTCAPEHHDEASEAQARRTLSRVAHHSDDLLDPWRIGGISAALVSRRSTSVVAG
jgi:hypothetical protein